MKLRGQRHGPGRVVFARVGWMTYYRGDHRESIRGGGDWDDKQEVFNFLPIGGRLYGYSQATQGTITLAKIASKQRADVLDDVLVVFHAPRTDGAGQRIVGWYTKARVHRHPQTPTATIAKVRREAPHYFETDADNAVLLPTEARVHQIPRGKGASGYSAITYAHNAAGELKGSWVAEAINFVRSYRGPNLLTERLVEVDDEAARAAAGAVDAARGQGHALSSAERKLIEEHAVRRAVRSFTRQGYEIEELGRPYDLLCTKRTDPRDILHVEVKGTQSAGDVIILTNNEVVHSRANKRHMILFLVHSIRLERSRSGVRAVGGKEHVVRSWSPEDAELTPIAYYCRVR